MPAASKSTLRPDSPNARFALGAVGWLAGPELIAQLAKILRRRSSPREWMPYYRGAGHDERWACDGRIVPASRHSDAVKLGQPPNDSVATSGAERAAPMQAPEQDEVAECWFDYFADCGDASESMYAIAYGTMASFDCRATEETWDRERAHEALSPIPLSAAPPGPGITRLPPGQFVFIGGDTAYHVADGATLRARVAEPFRWAFEDARQAGHANAEAHDQKTRRLYGIPGNHDWYDNLQGFASVFRLGASSDGDSIDLPQLQRVQLASYCAILLPQGWQLWGLDIDSKLDPRQRAYFKSLPLPSRLILATPSPAISLGARRPKPFHLAATTALDIDLPFSKSDGGVTPARRLDLSGDIHHYARYYPRVDKEEPNSPPKYEGYGSIVSGLGGAFHHPSFTQLNGPPPCDRIAPFRLYPTANESRTSVASGLLTWKAAWFGSWLRVVPLIVTVVLGFASTHAAGGAWLLNRILSVVPGYSSFADVGGGIQLARALCPLGIAVVVSALVWCALARGRQVYDEHAKNPQSARPIQDLVKNGQVTIANLFDWNRSYWFPATLVAVAAALLGTYPLWSPEETTPALDIATLVLVSLLPVGLGVLGWTVGAANLSRPIAACIAAAGFVHGAVQIVIPLLLARFFTTSIFAALAGLAAMALAILSPPLGRPFFRTPRWGGAIGIAVVAGTILVVVLALLILPAGGATPGVSQHWYVEAARYIAAGLVAMPFGTISFTWYLAFAGRLNGHNNEVGGAARVTHYRELIRFHIHPRGITGYVIAAQTKPNGDAVASRGADLAFSLIDVFTIAAEPWTNEE